MLYLVAYDVADPRRLRRVARVLERAALRVQKSVFLFRGEEAPLVALLAQVYQEACNARPVALLMPWVLDRRNLEAAWERVRSAEGANTPGPDGQTCDELARQGPAWLTRLADDLLRERFLPTP